jgi:hypothetical protein
MRSGTALAAGCLAAAVLAVPVAVAGDPPVDIVAAQFSLRASGPPTLRSSGLLEVGTRTRVQVRGAAGGATFVADALMWELELVDERTTLVMSFRVRTTSNAGACPEGARGTLTAVDDDRRLANGRTKDSVRVRFNGGKCGRFARTYANAGAERRARVEIQVELGP